MNKRHRQTPSRSGAIFIYYMVYLLLAGILLTSCGLCIRLLMKTEQLGNQDQHMLRNLVRLEEGLRSDIDRLTITDRTTQQLTFADGENRVVWKVDRHVMERTVRHGDKMVARESYALPVQTTIQFSAADDGLSLMMTEPKFTVSGKIPDRRSGIRKSIQIRLTANAASKETAA